MKANQQYGIFESIKMIFSSVASIFVNGAGTIDKFTVAGSHIGGVAVITAKGYEKEAERNNEYEAAKADLKYDANISKLRARYAKNGKVLTTKADRKANKRAKREAEMQAQVDAAVAATVAAAVQEAKATKAKATPAK